MTPLDLIDLACANLANTLGILFVLALLIGRAFGFFRGGRSGSGSDYHWSGDDSTDCGGDGGGD